MSEKNKIALSAVERIKKNSNYLRGTIKEGLLDEITGAISEDDQQLIKLHGSYMQSDRELESERKKQKLEPLYSYMIRVRLPAGIATAAQWLRIDKLSEQFGSKTIKLTTRQAFELHGVLKRNLKTTIKEINDDLMDTLAACGDVNRNVMGSANPAESEIHGQLHELAKEISSHFTPQTKAYHEIWLNKKLVAGGNESQEDVEPIYGKTYLPRKFKIAIAAPPFNDSDIFSNDAGLIAIVEKGRLVGFNIIAGGGMGMTFGEAKTYPRLASVLGYVPLNKAIDVLEKIILIQRDKGNRSDRKNARLKYTIDRLGLDNFKSELEERLGFKLEKARDFKFTGSGDRYGWLKGIDGKWHYTLFVEGGRIKDTEKVKLKKALREIAKSHEGAFILTGNQNLIIAGVSEKLKAEVNKILKKYKVASNKEHTGLRLNSLACVALNLCPMAFAEAERYLPSLVDKLDIILNKHGLEKGEISIRMTGCPNGCARPYLGEIGLVGKAPGYYNLYLGAGFSGERLNALYKEMASEEQILGALEPILDTYAKERQKNERFGDFVIRKGYVEKAIEGPEYQKVGAEIK